jgi:hypothetical protein
MATFRRSKTDDLPGNIPAAPENTYRSAGWRGYGDWLGTGSVAPSRRKFLPFKEARSFVRSLGLLTQNSWTKYVASGSLPPFIPKAPALTYAGQGWKSFGDWLGTGNVHYRERIYRPFEEAKSFARSLSLQCRREWFDYAKNKALPSDIPVKPDNTYAGKGWSSWGDWLGTGRVADRYREFRPFNEARTYVQSLGLKSQSDWWTFAKTGALPKDIPTNPNTKYASEGWVGYRDWLGTDKVAAHLRQ